MRIRKRPAKKAAVPFSFCRRAKKRAVFWGPMIIVRPIRKRICDAVSCVEREMCKGGRRGGTYVAHCEPVNEK
jgi:hypothetical protein